MHELYRRPQGRTERELASRTQLAVATLRVVLPKLQRRRIIEQRSERWRLTGRGRMQMRRMIEGRP